MDAKVEEYEAIGKIYYETFEETKTDSKMTDI